MLLFLSSLCMSLNASADSIDGYWNAPGVTVRQPNVWSNPGIMVTDPLGRIAPTQASQPCMLVRQCFSNGNCILRQVCSRL